MRFPTRQFPTRENAIRNFLTVYGSMLSAALGPFQRLICGSVRTTDAKASGDMLLLRGAPLGVRKIDLEINLSVPRYEVMTFDRSTTVLLTECLRPPKGETEVCRNLFNTERVKIP